MRDGMSEQLPDRMSVGEDHSLYDFFEKVFRSESDTGATRMRKVVFTSYT